MGWIQVHSGNTKVQVSKFDLANVVGASVNMPNGVWNVDNGLVPEWLETCTSERKYGTNCTIGNIKTLVKVDCVQGKSVGVYHW